MEGKSQNFILSFLLAQSDWKHHKRVCKERQSKKEFYEGMHGAVVDLLDNNKVAVDLDLTHTCIRVSPKYLKPEPAIADNVHRADVKDGSLVEQEGRAINDVLESMRAVAATVFCGENDVKDSNDIQRIRTTEGQVGLLKIARYNSIAWTYWKDGQGASLSSPELGGTYDHLKLYMKETNELNPDIAERYPPFIAALKSLDDVAAAKSWNVRVHGNFWVLGMDNDGTYLIPENNKSQVYQCVGVREAIWPKMNDQVRLMTVTMIPWYGRLVYDGTLAPAGPFGLFCPPRLKRSIKDSVEKAKAENRVISRLAQLEVEGGSLVGLDDKNTLSEATKDESPPSHEEKKLVELFSTIPPSPANDTCLQSTHWVFRRFGYNELENPQHGVVVLSGTEPMEMFNCARLEPTSVEILSKANSIARRYGRRPKVIGIDDAACCERVKFLVKDIEGTQFFFYTPPSKEETAASTAAGTYEEMTRGTIGNLFN